MQDYFNTVADELQALLTGDEVYLASFQSETSDFVRFNRAAVRQAGSVVQHHLHLDWIEGRRHAAGGLSLAGSPALDRPRIAALVETLRAQRQALPEDPHLLYATDTTSSERRAAASLPTGEDAVAAISDEAMGRDLVGVYAAGATHAGFANSLGQRNWYTSQSFNLDWSFHMRAESAPLERAVKGSYAGTQWDRGDLAARFERGAEQLAVLGRSPRETKPGRYRVYLAPAALYEIMLMLAWGGFGLRAHRTKTTPLLALAEGEARLAAGVAIAENTAQGVAPDFQAQGFIRPDRVPLVADGRYAQCLVSPRSAVEYGEETNGAGSSESPQSLDMAGGTLDESRVLAELSTGIYISNLWYLNYSDRRACRTTGMTRFATFWVENGVITAPLAAMRFDESVYRMLGDNLIGLTHERDMILDPDTYERRSTSSARLPGALLDDFTFTL